MNQNLEIQIAFTDKTPDIAGRLAEELSKEIRRTVKEDGRPVRTTIARADKTAQDFGTTIVLTLGTPAVIYLAKAILEWVKRTNNSSFTINGIVFDKIESRDVANVVAALSSVNTRASNDPR